MAYQNVGTPRFYVSILQWLKSLGKLEVSVPSDYADNYIMTGKSEASLVDINPANSAIFNANSIPVGIHYTSTFGDYHKIMPSDKNFFMVLGHQFTKNEGGILCWGRKADTDTYIARNPLVNLTGATLPEYNGFSIGIGNDAHNINNDGFEFLMTDYLVDVDYKIGSILYGTYYEMPHSPDLSLTMSIEMDGVKRIRTKGGNDLVKHQYIKPAMWGDLGAWELKLQSAPYIYSDELSHSGRRSWDLSFSYLQDSDLFPHVSGVDWEAVDDGDGEDDWAGKTLRSSDDFYSQVIYKTRGGQLPFIFQPNKDDNTTFAICKFDMKSFKFEQVANRVYNMKLKIREVW